MSQVTHEHARVASLSRSRAEDDAELLDARRRLRVAVLAEQIKHALDGVPALTADDRDMLAGLLWGHAAWPHVS